MRNRKGALITTTLLTIFLLFITPTIPAIKYAIIVDTNTSRPIQPQLYWRNIEVKEKRKTLDLTTFAHTLKNNISNETIQRIKEVFKDELAIIPERLLCFLILCFILADAIIYNIGTSLGLLLDQILWHLTKGKWEQFTLTNLLCIPSDILDGIINFLYELGMQWYDWPYPWFPPYGYH